MGTNMITARALALKITTATLNDLAVLGEAKAEVTRGPIVLSLLDAC